MKMNARVSWISGVALVGIFASSAIAQEVVYDNTSNPLDSYFAYQGEVGDQINIQGGGWYAQTFRFEYFASGLSGGETAKLRFWANNGSPTGAPGVQAPGELLYESPAFTLSNGNIPVTVTDLAQYNIALPSSFTWTVVTAGVTGGEVFGLKLYGESSSNIGSSFDDIWRLGISGWETVVVPNSTSDFGALLVAVPEPGVTSLLGIGALALLFRRRQAAR